jgi:hypothetical protein
MEVKMVIENKRDSDKQLNIVLFSFPYPSPTRLILIENLISILVKVCDKVYLVTFADKDKEVKLRKYFPKTIIINIGHHIARLNNYSLRDIVAWFIKYLSIQVAFFAYSIKLLKHINLAFFFVGIRDFIPLMIFMKLCGKKVIWY